MDQGAAIVSVEPTITLATNWTTDRTRTDWHQALEPPGGGGGGGSDSGPTTGQLWPR